jgi:hypothetical protein
VDRFERRTPRAWASGRADPAQEIATRSERLRRASLASLEEGQAFLSSIRTLTLRTSLRKAKPAKTPAVYFSLFWSTKTAGGQMIYRGYELEQKTLMVGWQVTITKDGRFARNSIVSQKLETAVEDAHNIVNGLIAGEASLQKS